MFTLGTTPNLHLDLPSFRQLRRISVQTSISRSYLFYPLPTTHIQTTHPPPPPNVSETFLPPVGGLTIYVWGSVDAIPDENIPLTVRVHDEVLDARSLK